MGHVRLQALAGPDEGVGRIEDAPIQGRGEGEVDDRDQAAFGGNLVPDVGRRRRRVSVVVRVGEVQAHPQHRRLGGERPGEATDTLAEHATSSWAEPR